VLNFGAVLTTTLLSVLTTDTGVVDSIGWASATATVDVFSLPEHASANGMATMVVAAMRPTELRVAAYI
ncbi:MAG: hypothetical protein ACT4P7_08860, partial [Gemmatimonadaceae bacterium]